MAQQARANVDDHTLLFELTIQSQVCPVMALTPKRRIMRRWKSTT